MSQPSVHIILLNWNGLEDTRECIRSLRGLSYKNIKIRVVDNASSNNEADMIETEFPEVNVLKLSENLGFCGGCNKGMRMALDEGADFVMLLNNDTVVTPGLMENLLVGYSRLERPGAVSPLIMHYPEADKVWFSRATWRADWRSGMVGFQLTRAESRRQLEKLDPYETEFACGCCLLVSSEVIREIGLFDERYFAFFDEAEWCARMKRAGRSSYVIPSATIYHRVGGSVPKPVMRYLMTRNVLLWMSENLPRSKRLKAYSVLAKDLTWNLLNLAGILPKRKRYITKEVSRVTVQGWKDFFLRRYGRWNAAAERIIFNRK